jgi:tetrapyrrole methylase family protein/MazG family protein
LTDRSQNPADIPSPLAGEGPGPGPADDITRLAALIDVVHRLRSPQGCPWDREQTHASLRASMLEEAYEVLEAIDEQSRPKLREELGDVLLQVLMQAEIAQEAHEFSLGDVADSVREKLVRRHPHVFGDTKVSGAEEVLRNWDALKAAEYGRESALDGVQRSLPALQWAWSLQRRAANVGFDWPDVDGALEKVREELDELREAPTVEAREGEFGDLLFTMVNVARKLGINPEDALRGTTGRFEARFRMMEQQARAVGKSLHDLDIDELDRYWEAVKREES